MSSLHRFSLAVCLIGGVFGYAPLVNAQANSYTQHLDKAAVGPLTRSKEAYDKGDYKLATQILEPLAIQGDAKAQFNLGLIYEEGKGVGQDYAVAASWYRKAADQGDANGQLNLGVMYAKGQGVLQDYAVAASWYRKAADQGNAIAQSNLGSMYLDGRGVLQDYAVAASWYRKAADQGDANGQLNLGVMYAKGQGVLQDYVQAHKWFNLSAARQPSDDASKNRDLIAAKMTPSQIAEAQKLAGEWMPKQ